MFAWSRPCLRPSRNRRGRISRDASLGLRTRHDARPGGQSFIGEESMMAAPRSAFEVRRALRSHGQQPSKIGVPLTTTERIAYECIRQIAREGRRATRDEICAAIGSDNYEGGTVAGVLHRLWDKGKITREVSQRGMMICLVETGQCTLPPRDTSPHWRLRTESVPTPAIQSIREKSKPLSAMIEAEGRISGKHMTDFLADLVYIGWHAYMAEKEGEIG